MKAKFIPGVHPSYKEQFDKLTRAYIENKVTPFKNCACFVGNLLNRAENWSFGRVFKIPSYLKDIKILKCTAKNDDLSNDSVMPINTRVTMAINCIKRESNNFYTLRDIIRLEQAFLRTYSSHYNYPDCTYEEEEDALFKAFEKTLELLKRIHISKGEIIEEEVPTFIKRKLQLL